MSAKSPTARSMQYYREMGCIVHKAEHWNGFAGCRQDAFGIGDLLVAGKGFGILLVQSTSAPNVAARLTKARASIYIRTWLESGGRFIVQGWYTQKQMDKSLLRNQPAKELRQEELMVGDL